MSAIEAREALEARVSTAIAPVKKAAIQHAKKGIIRPAIEKTVGLTAYVGVKHALDWIMPHVEKAVLRYVMPYCDKLGIVRDDYDPIEETERFYRSDTFSAVRITDEMRELADARFREADEVFEAFAAYARLADSTDRVTSTVGVFVEAIGTAMGLAPGTIANIVEESIEGVAKLPAYGEMLRKPELNYYAATCGAEEGLWSSVQVLGDVVEAIRTTYIKAAQAARREYAETRIMKDLLDGDYIHPKEKLDL